MLVVHRMHFGFPPEITLHSRSSSRAAPTLSKFGRTHLLSPLDFHQAMVPRESSKEGTREEIPELLRDSWLCVAAMATHMK